MNRKLKALDLVASSFPKFQTVAFCSSKELGFPTCFLFISLLEICYSWKSEKIKNSILTRFGQSHKIFEYLIHKCSLFSSSLSHWGTILIPPKFHLILDFFFNSINLIFSNLSISLGRLSMYVFASLSRKKLFQFLIVALKILD